MCLRGRLQSEIYLHLTYSDIEPTKTKNTPEQFVKWARDMAGSVDGKAFGQFVKWVISQTGYNTLNAIPITNICQEI